MKLSWPRTVRIRSSPNVNPAGSRRGEAGTTRRGRAWKLIQAEGARARESVQERGKARASESARTCVGNAEDEVVARDEEQLRRAEHRACNGEAGEELSSSTLKISPAGPDAKEGGERVSTRTRPRNSGPIPFHGDSEEGAVAGRRRATAQ